MSADMSYTQATGNLVRMQNNPNAIYAVGSHGKLESISKWNIFGRLYHHINGTSNSENVKNLINNSIDVAKNEMDVKTSFYVPKGGRFEHYIKNRPYSDVIDSIKHIGIVEKDADLSKNADELGSKCKGFYESISKIEELNRQVFILPCEVSNIDMQGIRDRLFEKYQTLQ